MTHIQHSQGNIWGTYRDIHSHSHRGTHRDTYSDTHRGTRREAYSDTHRGYGDNHCTMEIITALLQQLGTRLSVQLRLKMYSRRKLGSNRLVGCFRVFPEDLGVADCGVDSNRCIGLLFVGNVLFAVFDKRGPRERLFAAAIHAPDGVPDLCLRSGGQELVNEVPPGSSFLNPDGFFEVASDSAAFLNGGLVLSIPLEELVRRIVFALGFSAVRSSPGLGDSS